MTLLRFHRIHYSSSCWINVLRVLGIFFGHALVTLHRFFKASFPSPCFSIPRLATAFGKLLMHVREVSLLVQLMDAQRSMERDCSIRHLSQGEYVFKLPWWIRYRHLDMQTDRSAAKVVLARMGTPCLSLWLAQFRFCTWLACSENEAQNIQMVSLSLPLYLSVQRHFVIRNSLPFFPSVWIQQWSFFKPFRNSTIDLFVESHCLRALGSEGLRSCLRLWNGRNHWKWSERDVGGGRTRNCQ